MIQYVADYKSWKHKAYDIPIFSLTAEIGYLQVFASVDIETDTLEYEIHLDYKVMETRKTFGEAYARVYEFAGF